jgi:drug/metabolite transporter (DMT)-like permease
LCFALHTILGKRLVERNDPLLVTALAPLAGALLLGAVTFRAGRPVLPAEAGGRPGG